MTTSRITLPILLAVLASGCVSSLTPATNGGDELPDAAPSIHRDLPDAPEGAVWILPIEIGDLSEAPDRTTEVDGGTIHRKTVANVTLTRTGHQPVQIGMIGPTGTVYPNVVAASVPDREGAYGEQEAWGAHVLTTETAGSHLLAVAYQGAGVTVEITPHAPVEAVGEWRESRGSIHVYDSRMDAEKTGVATGGGIPGTAAYQLADRLELEGAAFASSFRMTLQGGMVDVVLDGPARWENHTRVLPPAGSSIGVTVLQLPPGAYGLEIRVARAMGFTSLVIFDVPEAPGSTFDEQVIIERHRAGPIASSTWDRPGVASPREHLLSA